MAYRMARPINFDSRAVPYDFRARVRKGLAGLAALRRGLGDVDAYGNPVTCPPGQHYASGACITDCGTIDTSTPAGIAAQFACVQGNDAAWNASSASGPPTPAWWCQQNPSICAAQNQGSTYRPPANTLPVTYTPGLRFTTSRGGSSLQPGDTWQISISGAQPNQPVKVVGVHPDGGTATANFGSTDGSGNFTLTGTITADMAGHWQETWYVGAQQAGAFSFDVGIPAQQTGSGSGGGSNGGSGGGSGSSSADPTTPPPASTPFSFSEIPLWGWIVGGVGLYLATKGK